MFNEEMLEELKHSRNIGLGVAAMNDLCFNGRKCYQGIVNYCRGQGWTVMTNDDQCMLSVHFKMKDMTEEVSIKVHDDRKAVVINTMLPVLCRLENMDSMRRHLQELNEKEGGSYGYFQMDGRRIVYVYAYTFEGETRFNEKAFHIYMDACMTVPYLEAEKIMDIATEHFNIPDPDADWLEWEEHFLRKPIITDPAEEFDDGSHIDQPAGTIPDEW